MNLKSTIKNCYFRPMITVIVFNTGIFIYSSIILHKYKKNQTMTHRRQSLSGARPTFKRPTSKINQTAEKHLET